MKPIATGLALCLTLLGSVATALDLGSLRIKSAPDTPLDVEIPLLNATPEELAAVSPRMPARLRSTELASATVVLAKAADGSPILRVTTPNRVRGENLHFYVVADWGSGRKFREYVFSVGTATAAAAAPSSSPVQLPESASPPEPPPPAVTTFSTSGASSGGDSAAADGANAANTGNTETLSTTAGLSAASVPEPVAATRRVVRPGETLMSISREWSAATGATLAQTMVGIYRANPQAFGKGGMSEILVNSELTLPDAAALGGTAPTAASGEISRELGIWRTGGGMRMPELEPPAGRPAPGAAPMALRAAPVVPAASATVPAGGAATPASPAASSPAAVVPPADAAPPVPETPEAKVARLESELAEKTAALAARGGEIEVLKARLAALEVGDAMAAAKGKDWLALARHYAALAWWAAPALLLLSLGLLIALLRKGRRAESTETAATAPAQDAPAKEMSFDPPPLRATTAEPEASALPEIRLESRPEPRSEPRLERRVEPQPDTKSESLAVLTGAPPETDLEGDPPPMDEAGSKINLARAFIEMGHHDAAILELQAALRIGDETQRAEAIRLLDSLPKS